MSVYEGHGVTLHHADCLDVLRSLPDCSVDAVVTDPPYGLEFMGKEWDAPWKQGADVHAEARNRRAEEMGDENKRRYIASAVNKYAAGLPFQQWCEMWATECLRVLKPGGHLLAFGGTRTWHRLACAIEDSGFEVRDSIAWLYGSGFSKGGLMGNKAGLTWCDCGPNALPYNHAPNTDLPRVRQDVHPPAVARSEGQDAVLLAPVQRGSEGSGVGQARTQGAGGMDPRGGGVRGGEDARGTQPGMGGRFLPGAGQGLPHGAEAGSPEGQGERLRGRAPVGHGGDDRASGHAAGGSAPHQPGPGGQPTGELEALPGPHEPLDDGARRGRMGCPRCGGLDPAFRGFSTTLKPAFEPVVVARKPLIGTVAATVLTHGTGALNIDGCRIEHDEPEGRPSTGMHGRRAGIMGETIERHRETTSASTSGRWPANVVLDEEMARRLDEQSGEQRDGTAVKRNRSEDGRAPYDASSYMITDRSREDHGYGGQGGASRFFPTFRYEAKAPTSERPRYKREGGSDNATTYGQMKKRECNVCGNRTCPAGGEQSGKPWPTCGHDDWSWVEQQSARDEFVAHPTVKPLALMRWLVRLVTPPGGTVLEPFAGSGTTVEACIIEGFDCIAIEKGDEYLPLIMQRINRQRDPVEAIRQRGEDLGLFDHLEGAP